MHKHQWLWISSFFIGLFTSVFIPVISLFGQFLLATGLIGWIYMHLEVHSLEFSANGSKHRISFTGYGSNRPRFRASMALIGPTLAKYMETGEFDTESINVLHESLSKPQNPPLQDSSNLDNAQMIAPPSQMQPFDQVTETTEANSLPPPPPPQEMAQNNPPNSPEVNLPSQPTPLGPPSSVDSNSHAPPPPPTPHWDRHLLTAFNDGFQFSCPATSASRTTCTSNPYRTTFTASSSQFFTTASNITSSITSASWIGFRAN